jgi:hypothetical protein
MALHTLVTTLQALGRVLAAALIAFWGVFFFADLDWFAARPLPPPRIWMAEFAHLALLVGLTLSAVGVFLRGSLIAVASLVVFFLAAGWPGVPWLFWITITPAALFAAAHFAHSNRHAPVT